MALTHDTRRALAERVQRRVEGRGLPRLVIDDGISTVAGVLDECAFSPWSSQNESDAALRSSAAVFRSPSMPDLGSRVRVRPEREVAMPLAAVTGASGRHCAAAVHLAADARFPAEHGVTRASASVSFVADLSSIWSLSQ